MKRLKIKYMGYSALWELEIPEDDYIPVSCPFPYTCNKYMAGEYYVMKDGKYEMYIYSHNQWYKYTKDEDLTYFTLRTTRNYSEKQWNTLKQAVKIAGWNSFNKQFQREYVAKDKEEMSFNIRRRVERYS